ncbi:hypothetical protein [Mycobacterium kyorinense]|uniref:hypothetical protein n=1 Tax=Mycobacterium kyorinense TaxID=487514 RepID=UPI0005F0956F|nr:hypothetical protein [Mycobacterium kyorinense]
MPGVLLELGEDAHFGVPCWSTGAARWAHWTVPIAYDLHYEQIRPLMCNGGISRKALVVIAAARARYADHATGRNSRPTNERLAADTGYAVRTVQRADEALRLLGVATEVLRGRQRTRAERFASWRVGDRSRGWASVWVLHENRQLRAVMYRMSSHPRSGPVRDKPCRKALVTTRTGSPTGRRQRGAQRRRAPDGGGSALARAWRAHPGAPPWSRRHSAEAWSRLLAGPARHGWTARDLNQLITDWLGVGGHRIPDNPYKPIGLLGAILAWHGADNLGDRPAALDDAREAAERAHHRHARVAEQAGGGQPDSANSPGAHRSSGAGRALARQALAEARGRAAARKADAIAREAAEFDAKVRAARSLPSERDTT